MALIDNLISYWPLNEASGDLLDAHGSNDLTARNSPGATSGVLNGARSFVAASNHQFDKALSGSGLAVGGTDWTLMGWLYLNGTGTSRAICAQITSAYSGGFILQVNASEKLRIDCSPTGLKIHSATLAASTWYHFAVRYDDSAKEIGLAINAGAFETAILGSAIGSAVGSWIIGDRGDALDGFDFDGLLDEMGLWFAWKSNDEVAEHYNGSAGLAYPFSSGVVVGNRLLRSQKLSRLSLVG